MDTKTAVEVIASVKVEPQKKQVQVDQLEKLGFKRVAGDLKVASDRKRKLMLAYEHYRFVRQEKIDEFNKRLKAKTLKKNSGWGHSWQELSFTPIGEYDLVPPPEALAALEVAMERKCFDSYEIAHIKTVKDPILFARINGCSDRFFLHQWDTDVRIEDILKDNEG